MISLVKIGIILQTSSVLMLFVQTFLAPRLLGAEQYGIGVFLLAPAYIAQGFFEPICQSEILIKNRVWAVKQFVYFGALFSMPILVAQIFFARFEENFPFKLLLILIIHFTLYLLLTVFSLFAYKENRTLRLAIGQLLGAVIYILILFKLRDAGFWSMIMGNSALCLVSLAFVWTRLVPPQQTLPLLPDLNTSRRYISHMMVRFPVIFLNSILVVLTGLFYSFYQVSIFKLTTSAVNMLRYVTPINTNQMLKEISDAINSGDKLNEKLKRGLVMFFFWITGSIGILALFKYYTAIVFPGQTLPVYWWLVPLSGVAFQTIQPLAFLLKELKGVNVLFPAVLPSCILSVFILFISNPYFAFAIGAWITALLLCIILYIKLYK